MSDAAVRIEGLDALRAALLALADEDLYKSAMWAIGEEIRSEVARYPGPPKYPLRWASRKQRFYVLRVLRKNLGPYVRRYDPMSQNLGQSWAVAEHGRTGVVVGTRATYAPYVQSAEHQQPFHADTGWVTDEQAVRRVMDDGVVGDILRDTLKRALGGRK